MNDLGPMTFEEAQQVHEMAQGDDPEHDRSSCWCCCDDCEELHSAVASGEQILPAARLELLNFEADDLI